MKNHNPHNKYAFSLSESQKRGVVYRQEGGLDYSAVRLV
jgi:hypothetical protein